MEIINNTEANLVARVKLRLLPYFFVDEEQWGEHWSGRRLRIDLIIRPRDVTHWRNKCIAFGVECKSYGQDYGKTSKHLAQCVSYTETRWDNLNGALIPILSAPTFVPDYLDGTTQGWIRRFAGQLNVGELRSGQSGIWIEHTGHTAWSEWDGVYEGKRWTYKKRIGSSR